jgi:hypothetical protein
MCVILAHWTFSRFMLEINTFSGLTLEFSGVRWRTSEIPFCGLAPDWERRQTQFFYSTVTEEITKQS